MTISLIVVMVVLVIIAGVVVALKSMSSDEHKAIPISNPNEIKKLKDAFLPPEQKDDSLQGANALGSQPKEKRLFPKSKKQIEIEQWAEENRRLKKELANQKNQFKFLEENLEVLKKEYYQIKEMESEKTKILKSQIAKIQLEKEQLATNHKMIEELKEKSEKIEQKQKDNVLRQQELGKFVEELKAEKEQLQSQDSSVDQAEFDALSNRLEGSIQTIEHLKSENKDLQEFNEELKESFKKTEELNNHLLEKEKLVQYELTKNRAQTLGLEKICEDFKVQIESMSSANSNESKSA